MAEKSEPRQGELNGPIKNGINRLSGVITLRLPGSLQQNLTNNNSTDQDVRTQCTHTREYALQWVQRKLHVLHNEMHVI